MTVFGRHDGNHFLDYLFHFGVSRDGCFCARGVERHLEIQKSASGINGVQTEALWEIDKKGRVLRQWKPGTDKVLGVKGETLYRDVELFEDASDFSPYKEKRTSPRHIYKLGIGANHQVEILPRDKTIVKWEVSEIPCPSGLKIESEYKYCVKEAKTERYFVLQRPCT